MPGSAATEASITANVLFVPSFSEVQRSFLLSKASVLVYTPANEHFGIVPVEAMYSRIPVVAVNSGGPTESILHESTGLLVPADPESFATAIGRILNGDLNAKVRKNFLSRKTSKIKFSFVYLFRLWALKDTSVWFSYTRSTSLGRNSIE